MSALLFLKLVVPSHRPTLGENIYLFISYIPNSTLHSTFPTLLNHFLPHSTYPNPTLIAVYTTLLYRFDGPDFACPDYDGPDFDGKITLVLSE